MFLPVCDAVEYAHRQGIFHGSLKPSNLLVGETADGPVPKVIGFGLAGARASGGVGSAHVTGSDGTDAHGDVYSRGAVLREMLTGVPLPPAQKTKGSQGGLD